MMLACGMKRYKSQAAVFLLFKSAFGSMGDCFSLFRNLAFLF